MTDNEYHAKLVYIGSDYGNNRTISNEIQSKFHIKRKRNLKKYKINNCKKCKLKFLF